MFIDNKKFFSLLILSNIFTFSGIYAQAPLAVVEERSIPADSEHKLNPTAQVNNTFTPKKEDFSSLPRSEQQVNNTWQKLSYNSSNSFDANSKQVYKESSSNNPSLNFAETEQNRNQLNRELQNMPTAERLARLENIIEIQKNQHYETKIKNLQNEVEELRGLLEAERHKIEKSLAQQKLLYEDLDRRFSQVKNSSQSDVTSDATYGLQDKKIEQQDLYTQAYEFIKQRNYPKAIELFNKYLATYPAGIFCANSNYWLGEIYMLQSEYQKSIAAFDVVLSKYPKSSKSSDAMYKKALVYIYLKDYAKAKQILAEVKQQYKNTTVARLADKKLQSIENFNNET